LKAPFLPNNASLGVTKMERNISTAAVYNEVRGMLDEFIQMWQGWGISPQTIFEEGDSGVWLLKYYGGNVLRPLYIFITPGRDGSLPWIALGSNEKVDSFEAGKGTQRSLRSFLERLSEYLVIEAAQAPAMEKGRLYIRKSGKHLYLSLPAENGDFWFSFHLRRRGWTWIIRRWLWGSNRGWVTIDRIYRPLSENPIETFVAIVANIGLVFL
jgi:hypothetical protein